MMKKALVSVAGSDRTGIIAKVSTALYDMDINILDISQTILSGCFTMMMVVDLASSGESFADISAALAAVGTDLGMVVTIQRMDIFDAMHNI